MYCLVKDLSQPLERFFINLLIIILKKLIIHCYISIPIRNTTKIKKNLNTILSERTGQPLEKIEKDIIRTKAKISEYQQKLRNLEAQKVEAENLQIVNLVKAVKLSTPQLTVLLSAYAKGDVLLPDEYEEELKAIEENEQQEDGTNEE